jgi:hypothetical protein
VQPRAAQLVARMIRAGGSLSHTDIVMLGLSLFQDGDRMFLVPNVVGGVVGAQRELRVHVEVSTADLPVTIERVRFDDTGQGRSREGLRTPDVRAFFESDAWREHADEAAQIQQFFESMTAAGIPGLRVGTTESGRPVAHLRNTRVGSLKVFAAMNARRGIWDSLVARDARKVETDAAIAAAVAAFRGQLIQLGFKQHESKRTEAAVDVVTARGPQIIDALRALAEVTRT